MIEDGFAEPINPDYKWPGGDQAEPTGEKLPLTTPKVTVLLHEAIAKGRETRRAQLDSLRAPRRRTR